jgi:sulfur-oxidizing protein SoxY
MKYLIYLALVLSLSIQSLYAKNPISSPTFDDIVKNVLKNEKYIFDDKNIEISVPKFADNPVQVPVFVNAKNIKDAKRMIIVADLNPTPEIIDMDLTNLLPVISMNIKVAQETPLRALILDKDNLWHIGTANIRSFGGGCAVASLATSDKESSKYLGKIKSDIFEKENEYRLKTSIFHPMETGLTFGNTEFFINKVLIKENKKVLSEIITYSTISENPRFIFETKSKSDKYTIEFYDNDGNEFISKTK